MRTTAIKDNLWSTSSVSRLPKGSIQYNAHKLLNTQKKLGSNGVPINWVKLGQETGISEDDVAKALDYAESQEWITPYIQGDEWATLTEKGRKFMWTIQEDDYFPSFRFSQNAIDVAEMITQMALDQKDFEAKININDFFKRMGTLFTPNEVPDGVLELHREACVCVYNKECTLVSFAHSAIAQSLRDEMVEHLKSGPLKKTAKKSRPPFVGFPMEVETHENDTTEQASINTVGYGSENSTYEADQVTIPMAPYRPSNKRLKRMLNFLGVLVLILISVHMDFDWESIKNNLAASLFYTVAYGAIRWVALQAFDRSEKSR